MDIHSHKNVSLSISLDITIPFLHKSASTLRKKLLCRRFETRRARNQGIKAMCFYPTQRKNGSAFSISPWLALEQEASNIAFLTEPNPFLCLSFYPRKPLLLISLPRVSFPFGFRLCTHHTETLKLEHQLEVSDGTFWSYSHDELHLYL